MHAFYNVVVMSIQEILQLLSSLDNSFMADLGVLQLSCLNNNDAYLVKSPTTKMLPTYGFGWHTS